MMYILALSFHAALLMYEPGQDGMMTRRAEETMLPTPVSKIGIEPAKPPQDLPKSSPLTIDHDHIHRTSRGDAMRNGPLTLVLDTNRKATSRKFFSTLLFILPIHISNLSSFTIYRGYPANSLQHADNPFNGLRRCSGQAQLPHALFRIASLWLLHILPHHGRLL